MIKCRTAKKPYEDTDGVVVEPSDIIYGNGISIGRATEEDVNRLKSLIKAAFSAVISSSTFFNNSRFLV